MTTTPAEKPADAPEATPAADDATDASNGAEDKMETPFGPADDAQALDDEQRQDDDAPAADDDEDRADDDGDASPRAVRKLRKENATLRDRAKTAEATVIALQQQAADKAIKAAGLRPRAVWAVAELGDVLADDGTIDAAKLTAAMSTAKQELGVAPPKRSLPRPGDGAPLRSGAGVPQSKPRGFAEAFGPRPN